MCYSYVILWFILQLRSIPRPGVVTHSWSRFYMQRKRLSSLSRVANEASPAAVAYAIVMLHSCMLRDVAPSPHPCVSVIVIMLRLCSMGTILASYAPTATLLESKLKGGHANGLSMRGMAQSSTHFQSLVTAGALAGSRNAVYHRLNADAGL